MTQTGEEAPRTPLLQPPPQRPSAYERFVRIGITAWCGIGVLILAYLMLRLMVYVNPIVPPLLIAVAVVYLRTRDEVEPVAPGEPPDVDELDEGAGPERSEGGRAAR